MIGWTLLVVATALVVGSAWFGARLAGTEPGIERALAVAALAIVGIVVCSLAAGSVAHEYTRGGVLVAVIVTTLVLALLDRRRHGWGRGAGRPWWLQLERWQAVVVALAALALLWRVVLAAILPPFAYDALTYHLTAVADWVQTGRIDANAYSYCCALYPSNGEVLQAWPAVFTHSDALIDVGQVGSALLAALAVCALARWVGVSAGAAAAAGALFLLTPVVLEQANTPYVDVTFVALFLAAAALLVRFLDSEPFALGRSAHPRYGLLVLSALAAGGALGAKHLGFAAIGVLAVLLVAQVAVSVARGRLRLGPALAVLAVFAACSVLVGGSWYLRAWIDRSDPVWPASVHAAGTTVFQGREQIGQILTVPPGGSRAWWYEIARSWYHDVTFWTRHAFGYEQRDGGLGPLWGWLGWAAVAFLGWWAVRRRAVVAVNLIAPFALLFAVQPYRWWSRFTIYLPALAAIGLVLAIEKLGRPRVSALLAGAAIALTAAGAAFASWRVDPAGYGRVLDAPDVVRLLDRGHSRSIGGVFFREYAWLDRVPPRAPIAVEEFATSIRFVYPFLAPHFQRRVDLLTRRPGPWLGAQLRRDRIEFLAVESGGAYAAWARRSGRGFTTFWQGDGVTVLRRPLSSPS